MTLEETEAQWPVAGDRLFERVHPLHDARIAESADERLYRMIRGYRESADFLVGESEREPQLRSDFVYPIVFLYRQCIELSLKHLLRAYGPATTINPNFKSHILTDLWADCTRMIDALMTNLTAADKASIEEIGNRIAEFQKVDPRSDALRYAHDKQGKPIQFVVKSLDLPNLRAVIAGIVDCLECVDWSLTYDYGLTPNEP